jgi:membrane protein
MLNPVKKFITFAKDLQQFVQFDIWQKDYSKLSRARKLLYQEIKLVYLVAYSYMKDRLPIRASALVYATLLGVVPLLAVTFSLFKGFGFHLKMEPKLVQWAAPLGDRTVTLIHQLILDLDKLDLSAFGFVGLTVLLASLASIVTNIERAFNDIWRIDKVRSIQRRFADYTGAFLFVPILLIGMPAFNAAIQTVPILSLIRHFPGLEWILNKATPFLIAWFMFTLFYYFVPNTRVHLRSAILGAFYAGIFWQISNFYFTKFIIDSYQTGIKAALYASFAGFLLFLIWLYLSWTVILVGAETSYVHQNQSRVRAEVKKKKYSYAFRESLALQILLFISRRFQNGEDAAKRREISQNFLAPERLLDKVLGTLLDLHFIYEMNGEEKETQYTLARSPQHLTIKDVIQGLRTHGSFIENEQTTSFYQVVAKTIQNYYNHLIEKAFASQTIHDILEKEGKNGHSA